MPAPFGPTQAGFLAWVRAQMQIPLTALPDDDPAIGWAFDVALATVNPGLICIPPIYTLAVYNLGGDNLINWANDQPGSRYFADARQAFKIGDFVAGVVASASDSSTSTGVFNIEAAKQFTLGNLQNLKTPWGRQYLAWAQSYGPLWGIS